MPALKAHPGKPFTRWWAEALGIGQQGKTPVGRKVKPDRGEVDRFIPRLGREPLAKLLPDICRLIDERREYAEATGDASFLILTASNIAGRILRDAPARTLELISQALDWEPNNPVLWNLWGRSLVALGRTQLAEAVFWEATRRFPDHEPSFVELGRLLEALGRMDEAEAVFRDAMQRFPDKEANRVELARLLAGGEHDQEALSLLREAAKQFRDHGPINVELARLLAKLGRREEAIPGLRRYIEKHQNDPISETALGHLYVDNNQLQEAKSALKRVIELGARLGINQLSKAIESLEAGKPVPMPPPNYRIVLPPRDEAADEAGRLEFRPLCHDARATRADFALSDAAARYLGRQRREELKADLRELLTGNPDHAYARIVYLDRCDPPQDEARGMLADFPRVYELRLTAALGWRDGSALERLANDMPERAGVTGLAFAVLGDATGDSLFAAVDWLTGPVPPTDDLLGAYVHRTVRTALERAGCPLTDREAVADGLFDLADALIPILRRATRMGGLADQAAA
jgi:tetratricopeptide (TPR) repeat protein